MTINIKCTINTLVFYWYFSFEWMNEWKNGNPQKLQFSPVFRATLLTTTSIRGKDFEDWHHRDMCYFRKVRLTVKMFQLCFCWYTFHSFLLLDSIYRWSSMEFIDMELRAAWKKWNGMKRSWIMDLNRLEWKSLIADDPDIRLVPLIMEKIILHKKSQVMKRTYSWFKSNSNAFYS